MGHPVVVTGLGHFGAAGTNLAALGDRLRTGNSAIHVLDPSPPAGPKVAAFCAPPNLDFLTHRAGFLGPEILGKIKKILRQAPDGLLMTVAAALEAWENSGAPQTYAPTKRAVVVGGTGLGLSWMAQARERYQKVADYLPAQYGLAFMDTHTVGIISELFEIHGLGYQVSGASASGNLVVREGLRLIRDGEADVCLVLGAPADWSPVEWKAFEKLGALNLGEIDLEATNCCPFDSKHRGFTPGHGAAVFVLERHDQALARGAKIWGEVAACGLSLDGTHLPEPSVAGEVRAMGKALEMGGIQPGDVDYVNTHGTASPLGDQTELEALATLFSGNSTKPFINATKAITGHCLNSAGAVELLATLLQMDGSFLHGNPHLKSPLPTPMRLVGTQSQPHEMRLALSNSFGFGGINTSLLVKHPSLIGSS